MYVYIGSFNYQGAEGITLCEFDPREGTVKPKERFAKNSNAGSMTMRNGRLYSTDEQVMSCREGGGGVLTFAVDEKTGTLRELSHIYTLAANTSGIAFDAEGRYMVVTHFAIGQPAVKVVKDEKGWHTQKVFHDTVTNLYRMNEDGTPGLLCDVHYHPVSQGGKPSFIHKAFLSPDGTLFGYANLGSDAVGFLKIDYEKEKLIPVSETACRDFSGPRHLVFHPTLSYLYVNYERNGVISRFSYTPNGCVWVDDVSIVPEGEVMDAKSNQSEILVDPSGNYLYDVMRGLGLLCVLKIDPRDGSLTLKQTIHTASRTARGAAFSPEGNFLLLACNDTQNVVTYRILEDGTLLEAAVSETIAHPASIAFSC